MAIDVNSPGSQKEIDAKAARLEVEATQKG